MLSLAVRPYIVDPEQVCKLLLEASGGAGGGEGGGGRGAVVTSVDSAL